MSDARHPFSMTRTKAGAFSIGVSALENIVSILFPCGIFYHIFLSSDGFARIPRCQDSRCCREDRFLKDLRKEASRASMMKYRPSETAPRDGTIIVGFFERKGKRPTRRLAAFDVDKAEPVQVQDNDPQWMHEAAARHLERLSKEPTSFIRPLLEDADTENEELGRMIGWRPCSKR